MTLRPLIQACFAVLLLFTSMAPAAHGSEPATIQITSITFPTTAAGHGVDVSLRLTGPLERWQLRLSVASAPSATRGSLANPDLPTRVVQTLAGDDLLANQVRDVSVRASLGRIPVGAYASRIELVSGSRTVDAVSFFTPVLTASGARATPIAWIWPIIDRPHRGIDGVFLDDQLADEVAPGGRLDLLVRTGSRAEVTWLIDPSLIADVEALGQSHRVSASGELQPRDGNPDAQQWLGELRAATTGRDVIVLPYGDPDLVSISTLDASRLAEARTAGVTVVAKALDRAPATLLTDVAVPSGGRLTPALVAGLRGAGFSTLLTTSREIPAMEGSTFTPSARGSTVEGVVPGIADAVASTWLARTDVSEATRVLGEVATVTAERPAQPRPQVLLPPRLWNPTPATVSVLMNALAPHLRPWTELLATAPQTRAPIAYSGTPFSSTHFAVAQAGWRDVKATEAVLGLTLADARLRAGASLASALREATPPGLLQMIAASGRALVNGVHVLPGRYTLTAKEQQIPVTVVNEFDQPARVFVVVAPHAPRVIARQTQAVEVPARGRTQVLVPITSVATGLVAADAFLLSSDGRRFGDGEVLTFDVRSIGPVAGWVLIGSTALLALAVALRLTRRIRQVGRERREEQV